jgi:hypothetical protein
MSQQYPYIQRFIFSVPVRKLLTQLIIIKHIYNLFVNHDAFYGVLSPPLPN